MFRIGRVGSENGSGGGSRTVMSLDPPDEQRHAAQLLGPAEERADVAAQLHACVDQAVQVLSGVIPERRAHDAVFDGDFGKQTCALDRRTAQARWMTPMTST